MFRSIGHAFGLLLIAAAAAAPRPAVAAALPPLVDEVLMSIRAMEMVEAWPKGIEAGAATAPGWRSLKPQARDELTQQLRASFAPSRTYAAMAANLATSYDETRFRAFLAVQNSPLAQRIQDVEVKQNLAISKPGALPALQRELAAKPPPQSRVDLIRELDRLTQASETLAAVNATVVLGIAGIESRDRDRMPKEDFDRLRARLLEPSRRDVESIYLIVYRGVSDKDLRDYVALYRQPAFADMTPAINKAISAALLQGLGDFYRGLRAPRTPV